jgi:3-oxoadipate enol-lactonase
MYMRSTHRHYFPDLIHLLACRAQIRTRENRLDKQHQVEESHPEDMERVAENARYRPQSPEAYMRQLQTALSHNASSRLEHIQVPTLVVHSEVDPLVPVENGRYLAEHIRGAQLICYPDTGHISIVERADDYNRDVLAFLAA